MSSRFEAFSSTHLSALIVFALLMLGLVLVGRAARKQGYGKVIDRFFAAVSLGGWVVINAWAMSPGQFDVATSLPLHLCDLAALTVPYSLLTSARWSRAIVYYWGLGLSTQGFITPGLTDGPTQVGFWMYWANHFLVVGFAIYDLGVRGFRPDWKDFTLASTLGVGYVAVALLIDIALNVNYGFVGLVEEERATILRVLGPWPWRVLGIVALGYLVMALLTIPWVLVHRRQKAGPGGEATGTGVELPQSSARK